jgi:hypothetical protein
MKNTLKKKKLTQIINKIYKKQFKNRQTQVLGSGPRRKRVIQEPGKELCNFQVAAVFLALGKKLPRQKVVFPEPPVPRPKNDGERIEQCQATCPAQMKLNILKRQLSSGEVTSMQIKYVVKRLNLQHVDPCSISINCPSIRI